MKYQVIVDGEPEFEIERNSKAAAERYGQRYQRMALDERGRERQVTVKKVKP